MLLLLYARRKKIVASGLWQTNYTNPRFPGAAFLEHSTSGQVASKTFFENLT
jgi:hypothetical protein